MSYTVNDRTIRLNQEATDLNVRINKVSAEAGELSNLIERELGNHQNLMFQLGALMYQLTQKEKELKEAVEQSG